MCESLKKKIRKTELIQNYKKAECRSKIRVPMYRKRISKTSCKIRCQNKEQCNARQGCDKFQFAAIEEKKYQTKIYKNAMELYRKRLKIKTSKEMLSFSFLNKLL
jgi:hypothetical protein